LTRLPLDELQRVAQAREEIEQRKWTAVVAEHQTTELRRKTLDEALLLDQD